MPLAPPLRLEPRRSLQIVDDGFAVIRARPALVLGIGAAFTLPAALVAAWVQRGAFRDDSETRIVVGVGDALMATGDLAGAGVLAGLITVLPLPFLAAAVAHLVGSWLGGHDPGTREVVLAVGRVAPALAVAWVIVHVIEVMGVVLLVVPGVVAMCLLACTAPAITLERLGPWSGVRRSWRLSARRLSATVGSVLLIVLIGEVVGTTLAVVPWALSVLAPDDIRWLVIGAGGSAARIVSSTFAAAATVILYLDLRVRTEGLDLVMETNRLYPEGR